MNHGSLFSGIGGFDLAAEHMGWVNVFNCEKDAFCRSRLNLNFPSTTSYHDITQTDFTIHRGQIDVLTGGDPCQPHSIAGKRQGANDSRYLWPEMRRAYLETEARIVVNENVRGSISNGALDKKIGDLESDGYTCWPPLIIPAGAGAALHRRDRVWLVAYSSRKRCRERNLTPVAEEKKEGYVRDHSLRPSKYGYASWSANKPDILRMANGIPDWMDNVRHRNAAIRAYGNAIDWRIALQVFRAIEIFEQQATLF
jgi:site-specific DNA-cytosine methylase